MGFDPRRTAGNKDEKNSQVAREVDCEVRSVVRLAMHVIGETTKGRTIGSTGEMGFTSILSPSKATDMVRLRM